VIVGDGTAATAMAGPVVARTTCDAAALTDTACDAAVGAVVDIDAAALTVTVSAVPVACATAMSATAPGATRSDDAALVVTTCDPLGVRAEASVGDAKAATVREPTSDGPAPAPGTAAIGVSATAENPSTAA
jgi:hypothetical protein